MTEAILSIEPSFNKSVEIVVDGWKPKIIIEYSIEIISGVSYLCWKIKNTEHVFRILATTVFERHAINFSEHFILTLKTFLVDYREWEKENFPEEWMKRYNRIYNHLI